MEFSSRLTQQWPDRWFCWGKSILIILLTSRFLWFGSIANATAATMEQSKALFEQSCASCHSIDGTGASFGPDLKTVTQRRDRDWLVRWIVAPDQVIASGDAITQELLQQYNGVPMPNAGLQPDQVESIFSYLESAAGTVSNAPKPIETTAKTPASISDVRIWWGQPVQWTLNARSPQQTG